MPLALLPNEPRISEPAQQAALTEHFLQPHRQAIEQLFIALRQHCNPALRARQPVKLGKPYPLGQCLEISQAVAGLLSQLPRRLLSGGAATAYQAIQAFLAHGGSFRQVWGDLRGEYFQNALLLGTLYIDVANDTVNPQKPPVEILPLAAAQLVPVADYHHFARVARRYWQVAVYPNHLFPALAAFFPLISHSKAGGMQLHALTDYMLALTCRGAFYPSEAVLREPAVPERFQRLQHSFRALGVEVPESACQGRALALAACVHARTTKQHHQPALRDAAVRHALALNQQFAAAAKSVTRAGGTLLRYPMPPISCEKGTVTMADNAETITIDGQSYNIEVLSEQARNQVLNLRVTDQEIARLKQQLAIYQTARVAYARALSEELPKEKH